jgi:hypothetical protein
VVVLILGAFTLDLVVGIDMHFALSGAFLAAVTVGIFWLLGLARKPK